MTKKGKRNPFPRPSLPQAGESLGQTALELFFDRFLIYFAVGLTLVAVAAIDWWYWSMGKPRSPWFWTAFAVALCTLAAWRWFSIRPQLEQIWQGRRGEREVGRALEELRELGYKVFHDIPGEGTGERFNIDHALIGPGGVFAIETKTVSKPAEGRAEVDYDGTRVLVAGMKPDRDPVAQVQASARYLRDLIKRHTGHDVFVRPVLLYPEWWINYPSGTETWVLNPKLLRTFLRNESNRLPPEKIAMYAEHLTVHLSAE